MLANLKRIKEISILIIAKYFEKTSSGLSEEKYNFYAGK